MPCANPYSSTHDNPQNLLGRQNAIDSRQKDDAQAGQERYQRQEKPIPRSALQVQEKGRQYHSSNGSQDSKRMSPLTAHQHGECHAEGGDNRDKQEQAQFKTTAAGDAGTLLSEG